MLRVELGNCLWLLLPVLAWNAIFAGRLPQEGFRSDAGVPQAILVAEHALRAIAFIWPLFMPLAWRGSQRQLGMALYAAGLLAYFAAWMPLLWYPQTAWSASTAGLLAPAYTPLAWLLGIAIVGGSLPYAVVSVLFVIVHTYHNVLAHRL